MKYKSLTLGCSLILAVASAPSFALNEVSQTWYASTLGNSAVAETTLGCIDKDMMYEKHVFKANTWDGQWHQSRDYVFTFSLFNNQRLPMSADNAPVLSFNTNELHNSNGSTTDAQGNDIEVVVYTIRPYEPITSIKSKNDVMTHYGIRYLGLDPQCDFL